MIAGLLRRHGRPGDTSPTASAAGATEQGGVTVPPPAPTPAALEQAEAELNAEYERQRASLLDELAQTVFALPADARAAALADLATDVREQVEARLQAVNSAPSIDEQLAVVDRALASLATDGAAARLAGDASASQAITAQAAELIRQRDQLRQQKSIEVRAKRTLQIQADRDRLCAKLDVVPSLVDQHDKAAARLGDLIRELAPTLDGVRLTPVRIGKLIDDYARDATALSMRAWTNEGIGVEAKEPPAVALHHLAVDWDLVDYCAHALVSLLHDNGRAPLWVFDAAESIRRAQNASAGVPPEVLAGRAQTGAIMPY